MWTHAQDLKLMRLRRRGFKFSDVARFMGKSRCACIGRYHRINRESNERVRQVLARDGK